MIRSVSVAAALAVLSLPACAQQRPAADPVRGEVLYGARCSACHSLDANRVGPLHRGVVGRPAGAVANYRYSPALRRLRVVWTEANLDRWLANPTAMAPGTAMGVRTTVPDDRADIIAWLRLQTAAPLPPTK